MQGVFDANLERLLDGEDRPKVLLAVSGGPDSMCMANLFRYSSVDADVAVAHMNFSLRGNESDMDEALVRRYCEEWGVECFVRKVDTLSYAREHSVSVEMAARELRYGWFYALMEKYGFGYLSVAHNANDNVETLFLNIVRGTGLRGLGAIREINGRIIRPLLGFTRERIEDYVNHNRVPFRIDRTNLENDYARNKIRNVVFPELAKINSSFLKTVSRDIVFFNQASGILDDMYISMRGEVMQKADGSPYPLQESGANDIAIVRLDRIRKEKYPAYWLYRAISEFGFNTSQTANVLDSMDAQPGAEFYSATHYMLKDRDTLKIVPLHLREVSEEEIRVDSFPFLFRNGNKDVLFVDSTDLSVLLPYFRPEERGEISLLLGSGSKKSLAEVLGRLPFAVHVIHTAGLEFPLYLRHWRSGDRFRPLGMKKFKKVSDFLVDIKMDRDSKRSVMLLVSRRNGADTVVAVAGYRIDDRFRMELK